MEDVNPYTKLTRTPLAQSTVCCWTSAENWTIFLGILSMVLSVAPGFVFAYLSYSNYQCNYDFSDEFTVEEFKKTNRACISIFVLFSGFEAFGILGFFFKRIRCMQVWFISLVCSAIFSRLMAGFLLSKNGFESWAGIVMLFFVVDIILAILLVICLIYFTAELRNNRYLQKGMQPVTFITANNENVSLVNFATAPYPKYV